MSLFTRISIPQVASHTSNTSKAFHIINVALGITITDKRIFLHKTSKTADSLVCAIRI
eukprot:TRINITY_DN22449_c0_g1_i1.p2 TRINITY_DN22449_c0_g1~~TRINITY_DN22449_c0_g1_i1.p2  ORF type:complete len:58 (+),score=3.04 TRINITY_DN22449_c0_g1_i1:215-388(+)